MINEEQSPKPNSTGKKRKVEITETGYQKLNEFLSKVNCHDAGRVRVPDILEYAVHKLSLSDIEKIQETYYSPEDKIELILHRENLEREGEPLTREQLLANLLATYTRERATKPPKKPADK